ncbi:hypothetical protein OF897_11985 [Chryseobacterium formosus]|uniref:Uncharacterized protein n=1 Tax=Chryseobacterium formosus TaxID=1537363 RepID=A0ABT3XR78_9FLAO|nr:hypothetical protein [Chryseobacterium formosus]MCX8524633.1 hypothetical protein [Chryseobacterium formosus]
MKKLIIFFAFVPFISNAQSRFIKLDSAQLIKHVESFIWLTERRADGFDIVRVSGTFDRLFKDFDRKADADTVKNTGFAINGRTRFNKNKDSNYWSISSL